jgi:hypothetical protein
MPQSNNLFAEWISQRYQVNSRHDCLFEAKPNRHCRAEACEAHGTETNPIILGRTLAARVMTRVAIVLTN